MNKFLHFTFFFLLAVDLSSNTSLEITTIEIQDSYNTIQRFPGKILPLNYSKLAFEVPGKIADVKIDIGDAVKKNEILAALDPAEMQANLNQAQARFDLAEQALKRFKDLKSKGFISNQELDRANSEFLIAKAQVDLYSVKLEQTFIRAPFDGYIQNRFLDSGTVISPGAPILEIIDSTVVEAHVSVPSNVIEGLKEGEFYNFLIDGKIFSAKLKRFTKMSNQGSDNRLCIFEFNTFISPGSISYLQLIEDLGSISGFLIAVLFVGFILFHSSMGLEVIIEDYIHSDNLQKNVISLSKLLHITSFFLTILTLASI